MTKIVYLNLQNVTIPRKGIKPHSLKSKPFNGSVPYLDISTLENGEVKQFTFKELGSYATKEDILVVWDGSRSGLTFLGQEGVVGSTIMILTPVGIYYEYLYFFLRYKYGFINKNTVGSSIPHVNTSLFFGLQIPYIEFEKQKELISQVKSKIERNAAFIRDQKKSILNELSIVKADFSDVEDFIKVFDNFKSGILSMAFSGKLSQKWRKINSKEKVDDSLLINTDKYEQNLLLPQNWISVSIDSVSSLVTDGKHGNSEDDPNSGYYFLSAKDIKDGKLVYENARQITIKDFTETNKRLDLHPGDLCIVNTGATIGKTAITSNIPLTYKTTFQKSVAIIRVIKKYINVKYLNYFLYSNINKLQSESSGAAIKNLLISDLKAFIVPIPPLREQKEIISQIDQYFKLADNIFKRYNEILRDLEKFERAVLQELFEKEIFKFDVVEEKEVILERIEEQRKNLETGRKQSTTINIKARKSMINELDKKQKLEIIISTHKSITVEDLWRASIYYDTRNVEDFYYELSKLKKAKKIKTYFVDDSKIVTKIEMVKNAH